MYLKSKHLAITAKHKYKSYPKMTCNTLKLVRLGLATMT